MIATSVEVIAANAAWIGAGLPQLVGAQHSQQVFSARACGCRVGSHVRSAAAMAAA